MAEGDPAGLVVCDTGPLIHLDQLDSLNLLRDFAWLRPRSCMTAKEVQSVRDQNSLSGRDVKKAKPLLNRSAEAGTSLTWRFCARNDILCNK